MTWSIGFYLALLFSSPSAEAISQRPEETRVVRISAERFHFNPSRIKLRVGESVVLELTSEDTFHGFRLPQANIKLTIPARGRGRARILFRADRKGRYSFECSRACGAGHTLMRGEIVVE